MTVPVASEDATPTGTLQSIADECGADDFRAWCEWIDERRRRRLEIDSSSRLTRAELDRSPAADVPPPAQRIGSGRR